jgi:hypothetical protein
MPGQWKRNAKSDTKRADASSNSGSHIARNALIGTIAAAGIASLVRYAKNRGSSDTASEPARSTRNI